MTPTESPPSHAPAGALLALRLDDLLERTAETTPTPGGGSVAAISGALAAALLARAARGSRTAWEDAGGAAAQAWSLGRRLAVLAEADSEAFAEALDALSGGGESSGDGRDALLAERLARAAEVPLEIAAAAADVASLGALVVERGDSGMAVDAAAAVFLADAAAKTSHQLVRVNLGTRGDDTRLARATAFAESSRVSARHVIDTLGEHQ